jgi:hypothetical protein
MSYVSNQLISFVVYDCFTLTEELSEIINLKPNGMFLTKDWTMMGTCCYIHGLNLTEYLEMLYGCSCGRGSSVNSWYLGWWRKFPTEPEDPYAIGAHPDSVYFYPPIWNGLFLCQWWRNCIMQLGRWEHGNISKHRVLEVRKDLRVQL